ncbi:MAG: LysR family transcriptional regulator [Polyangiaceae bacterium]
MSDPWLNFRHLYAFWMVARTGSFTRAASKMRVAQSAVSSHVSALEDYVGRPLLVRTNRSVELTKAGQELLDHADPIFAQSSAINSLIGEIGSSRAPQKLSIGVVGGASRNFVYRILDRHVSRSPAGHISVSTGSYEELYRLLKRFELDAIITLEPPRKKEMHEVHYQKLGASAMCVVATPTLMKRLRGKRRPPRVDVFKFRHPFEVDVMEKYAQPHFACDLALRMDTDDVPLLRFFANSGRGLALLPRVGVLEDLETGTVEAIELSDCPPITIYGITLSQARGSAADLWSPE